MTIELNEPVLLLSTTSNGAGVSDILNESQHITYCKCGNHNEVLFIAFVTSCSAARYQNVTYMELSKPTCHSSQSVIVTAGIICSHLKPLHFRPQSIPPRLQ